VNSATNSAATLAIPMLLAIGGVVALRYGLWPHRRGTTRYCGPCGYNLTGHDAAADPQRCPECGADLRRATVIGERSVRWWLVGAGALLVLFGLAALGVSAAGIALNIDWYQHKPTGLVFADAQSDSIERASKAMWECVRRLQAGQLSAERIQALVWLCLAEQNRAQFRAPVGRAALAVLEYVRARHWLTPADLDRYFRQMVVVSLAAPQRAVPGGTVRCELVMEGRAPEGLAIEYKARWPGPPRAVPDCYDGGVPYGGSCVVQPFHVRAATAGDLLLALEVELRVCNAHPGSGRAHLRQTAPCSPYRLFAERLTGVVEVVEAPREAVGTLITTPDADDAVLNAVSLSLWPQGFAGHGRSLTVAVCVAEGPAPNLLADVLLVSKSGCDYLGSIVWRSSQSQRDCEYFQVSPGELCEGTATVVVRSATRLSVPGDPPESLWDGELWFEDVPISASGEETVRSRGRVRRGSELPAECALLGDG
jgi:hypothetical protein